MMTCGRFGGNQYLCYVPTSDRPCKPVQTAGASSSKRAPMVFVTLLISAVVVVLVLCLCCNRSSRVRDFDPAHRGGGGDDGLDERPPVYMVKQVSTMGKRSASWLGKRTGSSLRGHRRAAGGKGGERHVGPTWVPH